MSQNFSSIIQDLHAPNSHTRSRAVFALDALGNDKAVLDELLKALASEQEVMVREDLTWALVRRKEQALPALIAYLKHENPQVRHNAAHVLGKIANPIAVPALVGCLQDEQGFVVAKVCLALGQIGDESAIAELVGILGHETLDVQNTLLDVLESFGEKAIPALAEALKSNDLAVREQVVDVLGHIHGEESLALLETATKDAAWQIRFASLPALANHRARDVIASLSDDPNEQVRVVVKNLLARRKL